MANKHYKRWLLQMPAGFVLIAAGILVITYSMANRAQDDWLIWGMAAAVIFNLGLSLLGNAYVHKVKSDLIRKERNKHLPADEEEF